MPERRAATRFIVCLGVVSLLADMTYEGARGVTGPFFAGLGATAAQVGAIAGAGELAGYALRLLSGTLADRTRAYWTLAILGYAVNLLAVPLLALAGRWEIAAVLVIAERAGKSIRAPPRDVLLSHAAHAVGRGWGFGLHAALDQVGACLGPLLVAAILASNAGYASAFLVLAVPAVLALATLLIARAMYPNPAALEPVPARDRALPAAFWPYVIAAGCLAAGYADFALIGYHFEKTGLARPRAIALLYALAMGSNALAAPVFGKLFDRRGLMVLPWGILISATALPLAFLGNAAMTAAAMIAWGAGIGAQDGVLRAGIAQMAPADRRGRAYGVFNAAYGLMWFGGSVVMGWLYGRSLASLVGFGVAAQAVAAAGFWWIARLKPVTTSPR